MRCLTIDFTLEEPVLCTQLDGEPNSARTFGFVPGSVLRGALAARYAAAKGLADGAAIFNDYGARQAFFAADVRYLNAYPLAGDVRALPASQAWFRDKHEHREKKHEAPIYDLYVDATMQGNKRVTGDDDTFAQVSDKDVTLLKARRQMAIHTMRDRNAGRATDKFGAVFRYEALAPGQTLRAYVLVGEAGAEILKDLLSDDADVHLGKARTAGYGRARAQLVGEAEASGWHESKSEAAPASGPWRLTLLSDAMLRDAGGRLGAGGEALQAALAAATCVEAKDIKVTPRFVAARTVGGFNRTWGLPLPQATAARMGSEYEVTCAVWTSDHLRQMEQLGVGERCSDGFGRIALSAKGSKVALHEVKRDAVNPAAKPLSENTPAHALAKQMAERLLRRQLDRLVMVQAQEISVRVTQPSVSQLKRMQAVVNDALTTLLRSSSDEPMQRLKNYMESLKQRSSVRNMFTSGRFAQANSTWLCNAADLHQWLEKRFSNDGENIDKILGIKCGEMPQGLELPEVGGVKAEMTSKLRREYSLRLVHAVLGLAAKRKRSEGDERR